MYWFDVSYGQNFDWGELGVGFSSFEDVSDYWANWRADMDAWVFDSAKASFTMWDSGSDATAMTVSFDMFTHIDAGAADILFGLGVDYVSADDGTDSHTWMSLPSATVAVESALNDWATLRAFANHTYQFSCDSEGSAICDDDAAGPMASNATTYGFGLGFNWGSASLDMQIGEELFTDPITTMSGGNWFHGEDAGVGAGGSTTLANAEVTLSYTF